MDGLFSHTERQIVILLVLAEHPLGGVGQKVGVVEGACGMIWFRSRFEASVTEYTELSTALSRGKVFPGLQVAHVGRAAVAAPCCAACVIVE